jgi:hypothetical protein
MNGGPAKAGSPFFVTDVRIDSKELQARGEPITFGEGQHKGPLPKTSPAPDFRPQR